MERMRSNPKMYRRQTWTQKFCAQKPKVSGQATSGKYDLLELLYTMKVIQNLKTDDKEAKKQIREGFTGKLMRYYNRVKKIPEEGPSKRDYTDLMEILSESTN
jgi:hypothetical protein